MHNLDIKRFWKMVDKRTKDECWEWIGGHNHGGYGNFKYYPDINDRKKRHTIVAHRFSYIIANGEFSRDLLILHKCDNPGCVNPNHLFIGTQFDNMNDMRSKGREWSNIGTKNGRAKLDEDKVREIKLMVKEGKTDVELSHKYNVAPVTIWQIRKGNNWAYVK